MLADLPPPIPLVCTIQSVESEWLHQPIKGIRELNHQQFVLHQGSVPAIAPRTVVDSRITTLVDQFSSSGVIQTGPAQITYQWSFEASLGMLGLEDAKKYVLRIIQLNGCRQRRADHQRPVDFRSQTTIEAHRSRKQQASEYLAGNRNRSMPRAAMNPYCRSLGLNHLNIQQGS